MKVGIINNLYKPYARGGAEKVASTIAQGLLNSGYEVFIITTKPYFSQSPAKPLSGPKIYYINSLYLNLKKFPKFLRLIWHLWDMFNILNYFKIKIILEIEKPRAVITNNLMGLGYLIGWAVRKLKIKQIHLIHDIQLIHPAGLLIFGKEKLIESYFARNYAALSSQLLGSPQTVIFPSHWLRDRYLDKIFFIKSNRVVLPNPISPQGTKPGEQNNNIFKFLYLGQIEKHKGVNLLIQAFKKVKEKFPNIELIIAGDGSELGPIKTQAQADGSIKILGRQNERQTGDLLSNCQALVVPTICYENCPAVIQEAFSAGLAVIAADLGGISELVGENAGLLFRPANASDLADKMAWAIENKNDLAEMALVGKAKAAFWSLDNYIKELERLIKL